MAARLAPSWANKQCWSYVVVKDKAKIEKLANGIVNSWLKQAKVVIVACGDPKKSGSRNGIDYYLVDVAISMEHLVLAATDLCLGTCWIGTFDEAEVKKIEANNRRNTRRPDPLFSNLYIFFANLIKSYPPTSVREALEDSGRKQLS